MKHDTENGSYKPHSLAVQAVDDRTVRFSLDEPCYAAAALLALPPFAPVPEGIVGDVDGYSGRVSYREFQTNPVGTGPFELESWTRDAEVVLSRFADYYGQAPDLDRVRWKLFGTDETAAYQYGQAGNADLQTIPSDRYDPGKIQVARTDDRGRTLGTYGPMANGETVSYVSAPLISTFYVGLNMANVETPARQAMLYVANQRAIVDDVLDGRGFPAYFFTPPGIFPGGGSSYARRAQADYPYGHDTTRLDRAKQVMEDAGYADSNRYEFTFSFYASSSYWEQVGRRLRDKLASAHVELKLESLPFATLLSRGRTGKLDAYTLGWLADYPGPENFLQNLYPPETDTDQEGGARGAYLDWAGTSSSTDATRAWQRIETNMGTGSSARQTRESAVLAMEEAAWTDAVFLPVYHRIDERFASDGVDVPPFGDLGSTYQQYADVVKHGP